MAKNGIDFDLAYALCVDGGPENEIDAIAMHVIYGEMNGGKFDWRNGSWEKPR